MPNFTDAQLVCVLAFGPLILGCLLAALVQGIATYRHETRTRRLMRP